jgi:hypothetical protein
MPRPNCDLCGRPATVHETVVGSGPSGPVVRHLCREHGTRLWAAALPPQPPELEADLRRSVDEPGRRPFPGRA